MNLNLRITVEVDALTLDRILPRIDIIVRSNTEVLAELAKMKLAFEQMQAILDVLEDNARG